MIPTMRRKLEDDLHDIKNQLLRCDLRFLAGTFVAILGLRGS